MIKKIGITNFKSAGNLTLSLSKFNGFIGMNGVKVNYGKFGDLLAKVKAGTGGAKE